jgi:hypothetical protein
MQLRAVQATPTVIDEWHKAGAPAAQKDPKRGGVLRPARARSLAGKS